MGDYQDANTMLKHYWTSVYRPSHCQALVHAMTADGKDGRIVNLVQEVRSPGRQPAVDGETEGSQTGEYQTDHRRT